MTSNLDLLVDQSFMTPGAAGASATGGPLEVRGHMPGGGFEEASSSANAVDIGLKVANEIMGLHSQAAAAGRALAETTRQAEMVQEDNERLKVGVHEGSAA